MSQKTCAAFFCSNRTNSKYRYCYNCAKRKGLVGNNSIGIAGWIVIIVLLIALFG